MKKYYLFLMMLCVLSCTKASVNTTGYITDGIGNAVANSGSQASGCSGQNWGNIYSCNTYYLTMYNNGVQWECNDLSAMTGPPNNYDQLQVVLISNITGDQSMLYSTSLPATCAIGTTPVNAFPLAFPTTSDFTGPCHIQVLAVNSGTLASMDVLGICDLPLSVYIYPSIASLVSVTPVVNCGTGQVCFNIDASADPDGIDLLYNATLNYGDPGNNSVPVCTGHFCSSIMNNVLCFNYPSGSYTATLTINGAPACAPSLSIPINTSSPPPTITETPAGQYCWNILTPVAPSGYAIQSATWTSTTTNPLTLTGTIGVLAYYTATYTVTVTYTNGCTATASYNYLQTTGPTVTANVANPRCAGGTGSITLIISGGSGTGFTVDWPSTIPPADISAARTYAYNLSSGTYTITVNDNAGCSTTVTATVTVPTPLVLTGTTVNPTCTATGSIDLTTTGGIPYGFTTYFYQWPAGVTPTGPDQNQATGLAAGSYTVTVNDENSCSTTATFVLTQSSSISLSAIVDDQKCMVGATGSIDVTATGGVGPYSAIWTGIPAPLNPLFPTNLGAGSYTVTVSDMTGCTATATYTVGYPTPWMIGPIENSQGMSPPRACIGSTVDVYIPISGGTPWLDPISGNNYYYYTTVGGTIDHTKAATGTGYGVYAVFPAMAPGSYTINGTDANGCAFSAPFTVVADTCCIKPHAQFTINGATVTVDSFCLGDSIRFLGMGGSWGSIYFDGMLVDGYFQVPVTGYSHSFFVHDASLVGVPHQFCYIAYTDTLSGCSDTACATIFINNCCVKPQAVLTVNGSNASVDTVCLDGQIILGLSGGPWAKVYLDSLKSTQNFQPLPPTGQLDTETVSGQRATPGTHQLCLVVYTDTTANACADTTCVTLVIQNCGCEAIAGTAHLVSQNDGNMSYTFYDAPTSLVPNFINWSVDGSVITQTVGTGTFDYQFGPGHHSICMQTATYLPGPNGDNICCYNTVCDTIFIDACAFWKATDSITFQLDSANVDSVTFTFHGSTSPLTPTLVWNFGDGTTLVSSDLVVGHLFPSGKTATGKYGVCVDVIWSRGDSINYDSLSVCCCVDTICLTVWTSPCYLPEFHIAIVDTPSPGVYTFQVLYTTSYTNVGTSTWTVNNISAGTNLLLNDTPTISGGYKICADYEYLVRYREKEYECQGSVCDSFYLTAGKFGPVAAFMLYPNPANSQILVQITNNSDAKNAKIEVSDMTGTLVMTKSFSNLGMGITQNYMNIGELSQGVYTFKMTIGNVQQVTKLVKE